jgi:hypothetical protein
MVLTKKFKAFDDAILDLHLKNSSVSLPVGSFNTKVIINDGKVVERVFKTPMGQVVSLFSKHSNVSLDQVA